MIDFFDRLDEFMEYMGLNDNKITVETGISNGLIGKGRIRRALSQDSISKILYTYPTLDANWLFRGEGEMLREASTLQATVNNKELLDRIEQLAIENHELKKQLAKVQAQKKGSCSSRTL